MALMLVSGSGMSVRLGRVNNGSSFRGKYELLRWTLRITFKCLVDIPSFLLEDHLRDRHLRRFGPVAQGTWTTKSIVPGHEGGRPAYLGRSATEAQLGLEYEHTSVEFALESGFEFALEFERAYSISSLRKVG